ncbi:MAG: carbamoyltransferase C-terminal domain-containing protein [Oricola sp.]
MRKILGVRFGHDAAACLLVDGRIVADVAEERFTRKKNDGSFPIGAISYCLESAGVAADELDAIAVPSEQIHRDFYRFFVGLPKPEAEAPAKAPASGVGGLLGLGRRRASAPAPASGDTDDDDDGLALYLKRFEVSPDCQLISVGHHLAHATNAYYTAGLTAAEKALVVVMDGIGDAVAVSIYRGHHNKLEKLASYGAEGSLGWFYSAATEALGWRHGSDEWKLMGLAPYGGPRPGLLDGLYPVYRGGQLSQGVDFGKVSRYPDHGTHHYHLGRSRSFRERAKGVSREDFAHEVQRIAEEQAMEIIVPWLEREETDILCCSGGFFLNVKFNGRIWNEAKLSRHWIYPNPGDAGLPVGAALYLYHQAHPDKASTKIDHLYLGPHFDSEEIEQALKSRRLSYSRPDNLVAVVAERLAENRIVGWFHGRMESGPRALGGRSILMSPLRAENKDIINASVKYREAFRPFCPAMLDEKRDDYLQNPRAEPFMITGFDATPEKRDKIPAVVHVDGTLRPQTVTAESNARFHALISSFGDLTGEYVLLNTSFNVMGEPIVCTPSDAIKCFYDSGLDCLVLEDFFIEKPVG